MKKALLRKISAYNELRYSKIKSGDMLIKSVGASNLEFGSSDQYPNGWFSGIASTDTVDRMNDIIMQNGWVWENDVPMLSQHDHKLVIGKYIETKITGKGLWQKGVFGDWELAQFERKLIMEGYKKGLSVGFRPIEYDLITETADGEEYIVGFKYTKQELLETSVVTIPANPDAGIDMIKELEFELAETEEGNDLLESCRKENEALKSKVSKLDQERKELANKHSKLLERYSSLVNEKRKLELAVKALADMS